MSTQSQTKYRRSIYRTLASVGVIMVALLAAVALPHTVDQAQAQAPGACVGAQYQDINGVVVIEMESVPLSGEWEYRTNTSGRFSDFTGDGYIYYTGDDRHNTPNTGGQGGLLEYTVRINTPGEYIIRWHNVVGVGSDNTEHNDSWIKVVGLPVEDFYARDNDNPGDVVWPKGSGLTPVPEGGGGEGFFKAYGANSSGWSWGGNTYDNNAHRIFAQFDDPGVYTILVSGRSNAHAIDRLAMYKVDIDPNSSENINRQTRDERQIAEDLNNPETLCGPFRDVPADLPAPFMEDWVEYFYQAGITGGCNGGTPGVDLDYCPDEPVSRGAMALFILRALNYPNLPHTPTGNPAQIFADVPSPNQPPSFELWIEDFYDLGITQGCGEDPLIYCPEDPVSRGAMAVFLVRALEGMGYTPQGDPDRQIFTDVPSPNQPPIFEDWIEDFYARGITTGCNGGTEGVDLDFCPEDPVTRGAMAVFILRAFDGIPDPDDP